MQVRIGTSGYQYKFWRGHFYSERCKEADMLGEYGQKLSTVEVNNTFYRMPKSEVVTRWAGQVGADFRFAIKAPRRITHIKRLREVGDDMGYLFNAVQALGDKLGVVLFQLPPNLKRDLERLDAFLAAVPAPGPRVALEFRHGSWFDEEVYARLRARGVALCLCDQGEGEDAVPFVATTGFGYLRLRREVYSEEELAEVARAIAGQAWSDACAYFKHEADAPVLAARLDRACAAALGSSAQ